MPETPSDADLPVFSLDARAAARTRLIETEWLLTNALGGFAMGTASGAPTRRYHALLVAALSPPVERVAALNAVVDRIVLGAGPGGEGRALELATFRFATDDPGAWEGGVLHPDGVERLAAFRRTSEGTVEWEYEVGGGRVVRSVHLFRGRNASAVTYRVEGISGAWAIESRPLVSMRDYHHLLRGGGEGEAWEGMYRVEALEGGVEVRRAEGWAAAWPALRMRVEGGRGAFRVEPHWWRRFRYDIERERGMEDREDLFCPGVFTWRGEGAGRARMVAAMEPAGVGEAPTVEGDRGRRRRHVGGIVGAVMSRAPRASERERAGLAALAAASDDFLVVRSAPGSAREGSEGRVLRGDVRASSVIAGYPWFADWGRDAMISLPGLCLATGRHGEALAVLRTFAEHCRGGLIPNRFDDNTSEPYYNTADAPLWFLHAATEYLRATGDREGFERWLEGACLDIVEHYRAGTSVPASDDGGTIRMDPRDYLIAAGSEATQLTWMDARRDGVIFTPRHGKPVELSALWRHGLMALAGVVRDGALAADLRSLGEAVGASMRRRFYSEEMGCLYDRLVPREEAAGGAGWEGEWVGVREVRPNQIFAVSLEHSALTKEQGRAVVKVVRERLLTRHGVRTLDPAAAGYRGRFAGGMFERDAAYHMGTAWPWLLPPLAEAHMRVEGFTDAARAEARRMLAPLLAWIEHEGGGQLPEVFDGDDEPGAPQRFGGCPAQAWSVAETLRVLVMACG